MRVQARKVDYTACPTEVAPFVNPEQALVTEGKEYEVHGLSFFSGVLMVHVIDDLGYPSWKPTWLFEIRDMSLPHDWICNLFEGELGLVLGPEFVAKDEASYNRMVELDAEQVENFWRRVDTRKENPC